MNLRFVQSTSTARPSTTELKQLAAKAEQPPVMASRSHSTLLTSRKSQGTYTISDALLTIKTGMLALALPEYYDIKPSNIVGITQDSIPTVFFDDEGFSNVSAKKSDALSLIKDPGTNSAIIPLPKYDLKLLSSQKIFEKFPFFQQLINEDRYADVDQKIENDVLVNRCKSLQRTWKQWSHDGLAHLYSSHQALQRQVASKMREPLALDFETNIENDLSVEYQCEIYADHLYGAKLLESWHHYLMSSEPRNRQPNQFLSWLKSSPVAELKEFGISNIDEIPKVHYMDDIQERSRWELKFAPGNIVVSDAIPKPDQLEKEIEIIFVLGKSQTATPQFFGGIKKRGTINHSSFFGEKKIDGAGRMLLKSHRDNEGNLSWVIESVNNDSGHIKPNDTMCLNMLVRLNELGIDLKTISWKSKWGTVGTPDETAYVAFKRLNNDLTDVKVTEPTILHEESEFFGRLKNYSDRGLLGTMESFIVTQGYKATRDESPAVAFQILKALGNHLRLFGRDTADPKLARSLSSWSRHFLRNIGQHSVELENKLEDMIKRYEANTLFSENTHLLQGLQKRVI